jgi:hypothetical protein
MQGNTGMVVALAMGPACHAPGAAEALMQLDRKLRT